MQANGNPQYAIEFRDVSRRFILHHERRSSFQDWFISLIRPRGGAEGFWALPTRCWSLARAFILSYRVVTTFS